MAIEVNSGRRKSMDWKQSELLFLHENHLSLESCQADGVEPRLTWQQLSDPAHQWKSNLAW